MSYPRANEIEEAARRGHPEAVAALPELRERQRKHEEFEGAKRKSSGRLLGLEG